MNKMMTDEEFEKLKAAATKYGEGDYHTTFTFLSGAYWARIEALGEVDDLLMMNADLDRLKADIEWLKAQAQI